MEHNFSAFLIKYAEIGCKGKNRYLFEDALVRQVRRALKPVDGEFEVTKESGRIYATALSDFDYDEAVEALQHVFGITHICPVMQIDDNGVDDLLAQAVAYMGKIYELQAARVDTQDRETGSRPEDQPNVETGSRSEDQPDVETGSRSEDQSGSETGTRTEARPGREKELRSENRSDGNSAPKFTFKVMARRARKNYPIDSMEINARVGEAILRAYPETKVDVHHPDIMLYVEIRSRINIYSLEIPGPGGMPVGTSGKSMLLLSGGIDSPVAGYMLAKRGVVIDAVYFHAPPYTSERAKQKVIDLARIISRYTGPIELHIVNFTDIQLYIYDQCPHDELTIIMRRYMMRIAETLAGRNGCLSLATGESLGQVASQTMQSLAVTNEVCRMPVFRPLIAFDKQDIIDISQKIGAFETSILPYEDCCTIFVAKHPVTKPSLKVIKRSEQKLNEKIDDLVRVALETEEKIWVE